LNKAILYLIGVGLMSFTLSMDSLTPRPLEYPDYWPTPLADFESFPITEEGFQLGRKLFYDPNLSRDKTISCASCHSVYNSFTHVDHAVSHGIEGRKGTRNSPVLVNLAWNETFHWDGGVNHLDMQPINPLEHTAEMDNELEVVLSYLNEDTTYQRLFAEVYGDSHVNTKRMLKAIREFTVSLVSSNSKYDQVQRGEAEFSDQELKGYNLFKQHCNSCHTEPLFNSNMYANNGLAIDTVYNDLGRFSITQNASDSFKFRIPTLRNIEHSYPYMHDGRFRKLREVMEHYASIGKDKPSHLSSELTHSFELAPNDQKDLISFMKTLTDLSFLYNREYAFPR